LDKVIAEKIKQSNWGDKILEQVSKDLKEEFPTAVVRVFTKHLSSQPNSSFVRKRTLA